MPSWKYYKERERNYLVRSYEGIWNAGLTWSCFLPGQWECWEGLCDSLMVIRGVEVPSKTPLKTPSTPKSWTLGVKMNPRYNPLKGTGHILLIPEFAMRWCKIANSSSWKQRQISGKDKHSSLHIIFINDFTKSQPAEPTKPNNRHIGGMTTQIKTNDNNKTETQTCSSPGNLEAILKSPRQ